MKLQLPTVTLICVDGVDAKRAAKVLEICKEKADFGAVKLLTHLPIESEHRIEIMPLTSLVMYSVFMLTRIHEYIDTPNVLIVQRDGWILNPQAFNPQWLELDYIGSIFVQFDGVGSGGFSMRSKKMMQYAAEVLPKWNGTLEHANELQEGLGYYEDGVLCLDSKFKHFKIGLLDEAAQFSQGGNRNPKYYQPYPFGFHGTWQNIDHETGYVYPICPHADGNCDCRNEHIYKLKEMEA